MTPTSRQFATLALLTAALTPFAVAQTSTTSSSPSTSSPSRTTTTTTTTRSTSPATSTSTTGTTSPTTIDPLTPRTPQVTTSSPTDLTRPVPTPVVPPTTPPTSPAAGPVAPLSPSGVTRPNPANVAEEAARNPTGNLPGGVNSSVTLDAAGNPIAVSGASIDALAAAGVEVAVDAPSALATIRRSDRANQQGVLTQLRTRVDAAARALTELRAEARATGVPTAGSNFDQAAAEVRVREEMLRDTLRNAGTATTDEEWAAMQTQLATQYQAYADSVLRARSLLRPPQG